MPDQHLYEGACSEFGAKSPGGQLLVRKAFSVQPKESFFFLAVIAMTA